VHERRASAPMKVRLIAGEFRLVNGGAMAPSHGDHSVRSREVRRYSRYQLRRRLDCGGFLVVRLTYTNAALFAPMAVARLMQRRRGLRTESEAQHEISVPPEPLNAMMTAALLLESVWLRRFSEIGRAHV